MDLKQVGWHGMDWIDLAQDTDSKEISGSLKSGEFLEN